MGGAVKGDEDICRYCGEVIVEVPDMYACLVWIHRSNGSCEEDPQPAPPGVAIAKNEAPVYSSAHIGHRGEGYVNA